MRQKLEQILNMLNRLDSKRVCLVSYFEPTMELIIRQHGSNSLRLNNLVGYLIPIKHTCILYPEDVQHIKNSIRYILDNVNTLLIAPIKGGYKVWEMGDVAYTSKPRFLTNIKFYSVSNRFLIYIEKLKSEEIRMLFRTLDRK